ncbi:twin-arginine translocation signal domain-containing protein, partial [Acinetobacter baumannii]
MTRKAQSNHHFSRRRFLKASASTAAVIAAAKASFIGGAHVAWGAGPEVK